MFFGVKIAGNCNWTMSFKEGEGRFEINKV